VKSKSQVWAGIDVSKDSLKVGLWPDREVFSCAREPRALRGLARRLRGLKVKLVVLEATGGLEWPVIQALLSCGLPVHRLEPSRARHYARALGVRAKTDPVDALLLARFAASGELKAQSFANEPTRHLDALVTRRRQIVDTVTAESNRLGACLDREAQASLREHLRFLRRQVAKLDAKIDQFVQREPELKHKATLLQSAPGVGRVTAATLISAMPELGHLTRRQVAALGGTAPFPDRSGRRQGKDRISGGRANVRGALYMAVLSSIRRDSWIAVFYRKLVALGRPKKAAIAACMRRLIVKLNAMVRDNAPWRQTAPAAG